MAYLLDVNVLLALFDQAHVHHDISHTWFSMHARKGWATCAITENAFVRIAGHPAYPNSPGTPEAVLVLLRKLLTDKYHQFWPDSASLNDSKLFIEPALLTHNRVTDAYLLGLAAAHKGKLATLDRNIPIAAVRDGAAALELIGD